MINAAGSIAIECLHCLHQLKKQSLAFRASLLHSGWPYPHSRASTLGLLWAEGLKTLLWLSVIFLIPRTWKNMRVLSQPGEVEHFRPWRWEYVVHGVRHSLIEIWDAWSYKACQDSMGGPCVGSVTVNCPQTIPSFVSRGIRECRNSPKRRALDWNASHTV